ncbi:DUF1345 domain-containing protein [Rhodoblastus sp. 17X3]|uniref:DUF1345 domain-containing protein n=1 Tax=Rhodoblastus sp. 17X3 TaxID=3047026 RepID=UPI0024B6C994|nr:DUF1345 domain-containing protein [Rhodoblastus sp. 17X3]MDI9848388.1 DUF1345 domain-containing protein [Rhodoblastus sp. 17X3]
MTTAPARRLPKPFRMIRARPRLFTCALLGIIVALALPADWRSITRGLIGWNAMIWLYMGAAGIMIMRSEHRDIHRRAALQDEGRHAILALTALASTVSFGAIFAQLASINELPAADKGLHIALALATIVGSWLFVHLIFALHYAHEFFLVAKPDESGTWNGGIDFPGVKCPDYPDFLYFSYVIGVACATADVNITGSPLRRLALAHCVLAFFYNNAVLAMSINIGAGFIGG